MIGKKKLPKWLKEAYRKAVDYICEECLRHESECGELEVHRMIRGNKHGSYAPRNCKVVCKDCHKKYHGREEW